MDKNEIKDIEGNIVKSGDVIYRACGGSFQKHKFLYQTKNNYVISCERRYWNKEKFCYETVMTNSKGSYATSSNNVENQLSKLYVGKWTQILKVK